MLRTVFVIGAFAILGLFVLGLAFHIFGAVIGLAITLLMFALKALIVGAVVYFVIRIVSPETARRLRDRFSGSAF
jgi:hypothetical protein